MSSVTFVLNNNLVQKIKLSLYLGAFVPLTMEGKIMVDEVLASCYPSADHDILHNGLVLARYFPEVISWIFGEDNGFSNYIKVIEYFQKWIITNNHIYEWNSFLGFCDVRHTIFKLIITFCKLTPTTVWITFCIIYYSRKLLIAVQSK